MHFFALFGSKWIWINLLRIRASIFILLLPAYGYLKVCWSNFASAKFAFQMQNFSQGNVLILWIMTASENEMWSFQFCSPEFFVLGRWKWNSLWKLYMHSSPCTYIEILRWRACNTEWTQILSCWKTKLFNFIKWRNKASSELLYPFRQLIKTLF